MNDETVLLPFVALREKFVAVMCPYSYPTVYRMASEYTDESLVSMVKVDGARMVVPNDYVSYAASCVLTVTLNGKEHTRSAIVLRKNSKGEKGHRYEHLMRSIEAHKRSFPFAQEKYAQEYAYPGQASKKRKLSATDSNVHPKGEYPMSTSNNNELITIMQLQKGANIVSCKYVPNDFFEDKSNNTSLKSYHFKNVVGAELKANDLVVVETNGTYQMATVVDADVTVSDLPIGLGQLKHIVAKVKNDEYTRVRESETNAVKTLALAEVTNRLTDFRKNVGDEVYATLSDVLFEDKQISLVDDGDKKTDDASPHSG